MIPIGFALAWVGYGFVFWGHSLIKGYPLSFVQVFSPMGYYTGPWPPKGCAPADEIIPSGKTGTCTTTSGNGSTPGTSPKPWVKCKPGENCGKGVKPGPCPKGFYYAGAGKCVPVGYKPVPGLPGGR